MTNTDTRDVEATVAQIHELERAGCELVRVSVYDMDCARAISAIRRAIHIPLVADIHFDHRLAIAAAENGVDKLRINPGNIGGQAHVENWWTVRIVTISPFALESMPARWRRI